MTAEEYVEQVVSCLPRPLRLRSQIAMDVRGHIAERLERGQGVEEAARQLGDPAALAASYVAAIPLQPVVFWRRALAKIVDILIVVVAMLPFALLARNGPGPFALVFAIMFAGALFFSYLVLAEYGVGQTLGKRLFGMSVVAESGTRISLGQSVVRQLPWILEIFWIDALFALFTDKHQRAFELLSKTRVVEVPERPLELAVHGSGGEGTVR